MFEPLVKEKIIQKAFGISGFANIRGKLSLKDDLEGMKKIDDMIDKLILDLINFIRKEVK